MSCLLPLQLLGALALGIFLSSLGRDDTIEHITLLLSHLGQPALLLRHLLLTAHSAIHQTRKTFGSQEMEGNKRGRQADVPGVLEFFLGGGLAFGLLQLLLAQLALLLLCIALRPQSVVLGLLVPLLLLYDCIVARNRKICFEVE